MADGSEDKDDRGKLSLRCRFRLRCLLHDDGGRQPIRSSDGWPAGNRKNLLAEHCWNDGRTFMFSANGQFTDGEGHHTTWLVTEPGVVKIGLTRYGQYEILPDGSFCRLVGHRKLHEY